ncbi:hypothetical protein BDW60DRAFT_195856, partial [Aspergillus nidulans var. acristatus]
MPCTFPDTSLIRAILRCRIHYGSRVSILPYGKVQEIFSQATVYTTENTSRHFSLGDGLETETSYRGHSHLEKFDGNLRVFAPVMKDNERFATQRHYLEHSCSI